jgi:hypothetical protein
MPACAPVRSVCTGFPKCAGNAIVCGMALDERSPLAIGSDRSCGVMPVVALRRADHARET